MTTDSETLLETECGTRSYMAPEIFERRGYNGDGADIWSSGVVLFIMLCGSPPFDIANRKDWWFNAVSVIIFMIFIYFFIININIFFNYFS